MLKVSQSEPRARHRFKPSVLNGRPPCTSRYLLQREPYFSLAYSPNTPGSLDGV